MEHLRTYIDHFTDMSDSMWRQLVPLFEEVHYSKGEHIYGRREVSEAIYFITDGIVRSYILEADGKDFTWSFHCLNTDALEHRMLMDIAVVDYVSFTQGVPEELAFEVLSDATLMRVDKRALQRLYANDIAWQRFAAAMAEDVYALTRRRTFALLTQSAKARLEALIAYYPGVFEKNVSMEHIASYLGITRQSLNRLLRRLEQEGTFVPRRNVKSSYTPDDFTYKE